jgi:hypothetical protein
MTALASARDVSTHRIASDQALAPILHRQMKGFSAFHRDGRTADIARLVRRVNSFEPPRRLQRASFNAPWSTMRAGRIKKILRL